MHILLASPITKTDQNPINITYDQILAQREDGLNVEPKTPQRKFIGWFALPIEDW